MRYLILIASLLFVTSCATVEKRQVACEEQFNNFADIFSCTKSSIASDVRLNKKAEVKLYLLKGEQLVEQLKNGKISEIDAKTEWQKLFVELKQSEDRQRASAIQNYNATKPKQTYCVPIGNSVSCTTY
jgi:hypothetical protein